MKILHTADWHLGAKLENKPRDEEHKAALNWLLELIAAQQIELLIVAGDIFDVYNPSNVAESLYYNFIKNLSKTCCHTAIICAGNHDSPQKLEAAKSLLEVFNVKIIAQIPNQLNEHIIEVVNPKTSELQAVVAAVPFLTDSYLRNSQPAESSEERIAQISNGIKQHYFKINELCQPYLNKNIPIICTGHLAVSQADKNNRSRYNSIHLGSLDVVDTNCFSADFNYVALGHLHYPHKVGENNHIRYSGSLIALDFKESLHPQQVYVVESQLDKIIDIQSFHNPYKRDLLLWSGTEQEIEAKINKYSSSNPYFKTWLRLEILSEAGFDPQLKDKFIKAIQNLNIELIGEPRMKKIAKISETDQLQAEFINLQQLNPRQVFEKRIATESYPAEKEKKLLYLFDELLIWQKEQLINK